MTTTDDLDADPATRDREIVPSGTGFRWTCPFCGKSRINRSDGRTGEENAIAALRTHIVASEGAGHGPRNELPDETPELEGHVVEVDGRGGFGRATEG